MGRERPRPGQFDRPPIPKEPPEVPDLPEPGDGIFSKEGLQLLRDIKKILQVANQPAAVHPYFFRIPLDTGNQAQVIFPTAQIVTYAVIQNISTENVSVARRNIPPTVGSDIILNAASAAGEGGGNLPVHNINMRSLMFIRTTAGATLSVYAEIPTINLPPLLKSLLV